MRLLTKDLRQVTNAPTITGSGGAGVLLLLLICDLRMCVMCVFISCYFVSNHQLPVFLLISLSLVIPVLILRRQDRIKLDLQRTYIVLLHESDGLHKNTYVIYCCLMKKCFTRLNCVYLCHLLQSTK